MSYGTKYRITVQSRKWKNTVRIDIEKEGYASTIFTKSLGAGGIQLEKAGDGIINGTNLSFAIQCDVNFEYVEFFTSVPRTFRVVLYVNDVAQWTGFIIPEEHSEPLINPPYDVHVKAVDGLGLLKNYDYPANTDNYSVFARNYLLWKILTLTGLELELAIAYDVQLGETEQNEWLFDYVNVDETCLTGKTAYDALCQLIPPDATITQSGNRWLIRRNEQDHYKDHRILTFGTASYLHDRFENGETVLQLAAMGDGDLYPIGMATLGMEFAWKKFTLNEVRGLRESFLKNHKFANGITRWEKTGSEFVSTRESDNNSYLVMSGKTSSFTEYLSQSVNWINEDEFIFTYRTGCRGYARRNFSTGAYGISNFVRCTVKLTCQVKIVGLLGETYYLDKEDGWVSAETNIEEEVTAHPRAVEFHEVSIYASSPPVSGTMTIKIYRVVDNSANNIIESYWTDLILKTQAADDYEGTVSHVIELVPHAAVEEEIDLYPCDVPAVANAMNIFTGGQYDYDQPITAYLNNKTQVGTYLAIIRNSLVYLHGVIRQVLEGTFRGQNLHLNSVIQCLVCSNRKYILRSGTHDFYNDRISGQFLEIPATAEDSKWILKDGIWEDNGIWLDNEYWYDEDPA